MSKESEMPPTIGEVFAGLKSELTWAHGRWDLYRQLFLASERRIALLNECAGVFFRVLQDVLLDDTALVLSKLGDPAKTFNKYPNLSFAQLEQRIIAHGDAQLSSNVQGLVAKYAAAIDTFKMWRDKRLAHLDLQTAITSPMPLPGITMGMIEAALDAATSILNEVERHFDDATTLYRLFRLRGDADAMIGLLKGGLRYEQLMQEGVIPFEDTERDPWAQA